VRGPAVVHQSAKVAGQYAMRIERLHAAHAVHALPRMGCRDCGM
jgi:hypothetical protein